MICLNKRALKLRIAKPANFVKTNVIFIVFSSDVSSDYNLLSKCCQVHSRGIVIAKMTSATNMWSNLNTVLIRTIQSSQLFFSTKYLQKLPGHAAVYFCHNYSPPPLPRAPLRILTENLPPLWGFCILTFPGGGGIHWRRSRWAGICL